MNGFEVRLQIEIQKGANYREVRNYYMKRMSDILKSIEDFPGLPAKDKIMAIHLIPFREYPPYD
jgi:hypothetical protein